ncbi:MAG TPA: hypothetical protein VJV58_01420 [Bradyrhizobium sp.]|uniref:hypothetical protein n=1 Tax=Bradyrhizobium sp. TaxID=376 RepID=UPI002B459D32|nr:hypothetical protein [Bradyrhizobium sp.]HKO69568.1 hypothetical protein [Bradyrhizobium sp.]
MKTGDGVALYTTTGSHIYSTPPRSRCGIRPSFARHEAHLEIQRAQGMPGARRARSLVCKIKKHTSVVTTVTPKSSGIPRATVLRFIT